MENSEFNFQSGQLVAVHKDVPVTTSKIVADGLGLTHKVILQNIKRNTKNLEQFGPIALEVLLPELGGRDIITYLLNENQSLFIGTLSRNTEKVTDFKVKLIKEFSAVREELRKLQIEKETQKLSGSKKTSTLKIPKITDYTKLYEHADQEAEFHGYMESKSKLLYKKLFIKAATGFDLPFPYGVRESDLIRIYAAFNQTPPTNQYVVRNGLAICEEALECEIRYENEKDRRFREREERLDERYANRGQKRPVPTENNPFADIIMDDSYSW